MEPKTLPAPPSQNAADTVRQILRTLGGIEIALIQTVMRALFKHDAGFSLLPPQKLDALKEYTALAVGHAAILTAPPLLFGRFIDALTRQDGAAAFAVFAGFALATAGAELAKRALGRQIRTLSREWELEMQMRLLNTFQALTPGQSERFKPGDVALKFFRDAANLGDFWRSFYPQFVCAGSMAVFATLGIMGKNTGVAVLFLVLITLSLLPNLKWRKTFGRLRRILRRFNDSALNRVFEAMHILPYLKSLAAETPYSDETRGKLRRFNMLNRRHDRAEVDFEAASQLALAGGQAAILVVSMLMALDGEITAGDVAAFNTLFLAMHTSLVGIFKLLPNLENVRESVRSVDELFNAPGVELAPERPASIPAAADIAASGVCFTYPGGKKPVLKNFSVTIPGGSIVGVTGENGAGKTTLLKLLTGTLFPDRGKITVGGVDLAQCALPMFRARIASVFQESLLITGTIRDNITLKDPRYTAADLRYALELSGADSLAARMPEGLDHRIGFDGGGLSGGERQKVAIARALIRRPDILIFDEVTNHLDYESRLKMRDLLTRLKGKCTVLLVSHDPELVRHCDYELKLTPEK